VQACFRMRLHARYVVVEGRGGLAFEFDGSICGDAAQETQEDYRAQFYRR